MKIKEIEETTYNVVRRYSVKQHFIKFIDGKVSLLT